MKLVDQLIDHVCSADECSKSIREFLTLESMQKLYEDLSSENENSHLGKGD